MGYKIDNEQPVEVKFIHKDTNEVVFTTQAILSADAVNKNMTVYPIEALRNCSVCHDVGMIHDENGDLTFCDCVPEEFQNYDLNNADVHA